MEADEKSGDKAAHLREAQPAMACPKAHSDRSEPLDSHPGRPIWPAAKGGAKRLAGLTFQRQDYVADNPWQSLLHGLLLNQLILIKVMDP